MVKLSKIIEECSDGKIFVFPFRLCGSAYASTKKKPARITISIPEEICGGTLSDLDKWSFVVVAIDKEERKRVWNKLTGKEDQSKKDGIKELKKHETFRNT